MGYNLPVQPDSITVAGHNVALGGSQNLAASDLTNGTTGSGDVVLATSPSLTTPALGAAAASTLNITGSFPGSIGSTPVDLLTVDIGSFPVGDKIPAGTLETFESSIVIPTSFTGAPWPVTNYSAYVQQNDTASGASAVPFFSKAIIGTTSTTNSVYGLNSILANQTAAQSNGNDFNAMVGVEIDINLTALAGSAQPDGWIYGLTFRGASNTTTSSSEFMAIDLWALNSTTNTNPWLHGYYTRDGATSGSFVEGGCLEPPGTSPSQSQVFALRSRNSSGSLGYWLMATDGNAILHTYGSGVGNGAILVGNTTGTLDTNAIALFHAATNENLEIRGNISLGSGVALSVVNDALSAEVPLEILASTMQISCPLTVTGTLTVGTTTLISSSVSLTNGAASNTATLTNAPTSGNPTKWISINDNGTTRHIPAW